MNDKTSSITIRIIGSKHYEEAMTMCEDTFQVVVPRETVRAELRTVDPNLSIGIFRGEKLIACMMSSIRSVPLGERQEVRSEMSRRKGYFMEGLASEKAERGKGYGRLLREATIRHAIEIGCEYTWGMALLGLNNRDAWLQTHALMSENEDLIAFARPLVPDFRSLDYLATPECLESWSAKIKSGPQKYEGEIALQIMGDTKRLWLHNDNVAMPLSLTHKEFKRLNNVGGRVVIEIDKSCRLLGSHPDNEPELAFNR